MITAETIFHDHFLPLYPPGADLARLRQEDVNPAKNPAILGELDRVADVFVAMAPSALDEHGLVLDYSDASVHRLSAGLVKARDRLFAVGEAGTAESLLFNVVVHGAAYVGACIVRHHGGAWAVRRPLWESLVHVKSAAGEGDLPVFHWLLKSLAGDVTLADRYRAHVEGGAPPDFPIIAEQRPLPRLAKVRYDALYKYLRAHLPEIRDVGDHFPSPERFDELGFKHLSFTLVGGGRMLVLHGPTAHGLHAIWLTRSGFEKAAFWPCDAFPEPLLRVREDKLEVVLSLDGTTAAHEILWWGP